MINDNRENRYYNAVVEVYKKIIKKEKVLFHDIFSKYEVSHTISIVLKRMGIISTVNNFWVWNSNIPNTVMIKDIIQEIHIYNKERRKARNDAKKYISIPVNQKCSPMFEVLDNELCIEHLKKQGYKIMKPVTKFEEC